MSEQHNKKDPIEEFFKKKAEDYDIPYNETDWLNLEKRLDLVDQQRAYRKRQRWILAASILIVSLLGYFTYENYLRINQITQLLDGESVPEAQPGTGPDTPAGDRPVLEGNRNDAIAADDSARGSHNAPLLSLSPEQVKQRKNTESNQAEKVTERGNQPLRTISSTARALFVSDLSCPTCTLAGTSGSEDNSKLDPAIMSPYAGTDVAHLFASADNTSPVTVNALDNTPRRTPRAAVGLIIGPDLSTVGSISNFYNPGYKLGVAIEYRLSPKLSLMSGIIQSEVRYLAQGNEYKPPSGYWSYGVVPDETLGECILLDIPIGLKYDFMDFNRSRLYATAGLSSYIMLSEDYRFKYDREDTGLVQGWNAETGTRHWMSNAGFSIGYELDVHSNWSIRAEPFVKVPLREVGWGNVKLYSVGSFFSINFKL